MRLALTQQPLDDLNAPDRVFRAALGALEPELATLDPLIARFQRMIRERQVDGFDMWLADARACGVKEFHRFAMGLQHDYAAVHAALVEPWSNGPVEGHVNRIKTIKRQMYGRAKFDLLRIRVLNYPPGHPKAVINDSGNG